MTDTERLAEATRKCADKAVELSNENLSLRTKMEEIQTAVSTAVDAIREANEDGDCDAIEEACDELAAKLG